jgi:hypothetical protein
MPPNNPKPNKKKKVTFGGVGVDMITQLNTIQREQRDTLYKESKNRSEQDKTNKKNEDNVNAEAINNANINAEISKLNDEQCGKLSKFVQACGDIYITAKVITPLRKNIGCKRLRL